MGITSQKNEGPDIFHPLQCQTRGAPCLPKIDAGVQRPFYINFFFAIPALITLSHHPSSILMAMPQLGRFYDDPDRIIWGSTCTLVTLLRPWIRRFTMIISARWLQTGSKFSGQEFEEIQKPVHTK